MTTDEEMALRRLEQEATPGPWRVGSVEKWHVFAPHPEGLAGPSGERVVLRMNEHFPYAADALFIAGARTALPTLLDEIEQLRRERDDARATAHAMLQSDNAQLQAERERAEKAEAACAQFRAALVDLQCPHCRNGEPREDNHSHEPTDYHGYSYRPCQTPEASDLLKSTDAGKGWLSPAAAAEKQRTVECTGCGFRFGWEHVHDHETVEQACPVCDLERGRADAEKLQREAAAMRRALELAELPLRNTGYYGTLTTIRDALSTDAGAGYVRLDDVLATIRKQPLPCETLAKWGEQDARAELERKVRALVKP